MKMYLLLVVCICTNILFAQAPFQVKRAKCLKKTVRQELKGFEMRLKNVRYRGARRSIGYFNEADSILGMNQGIVLTTGRIQTIAGDNQETATTTANFNKGHRILKKVTQEQLYDAAILQFDFYPNSDFVSFNFAWGSEDYPEFLESKYGDFLTFLLTMPDGRVIDLARLANEDEIHASTINQEQQAMYYVNNCEATIPVVVPESDTFQQSIKGYDLVLAQRPNVDLARHQKAVYPIAFDGFTKVIKAQCAVQPHLRHRLQIAIADRGNRIYDSAVFIEMGSFHSHSNPDFCSGILARTPNYYYHTDTLSRTPKKTIVVKHSEKEVCLSKRVQVQFDYDSPKLSNNALKMLQEIAQKLQKCPNLGVEINGYAAAENNDVYNQALSEKRARRVRDYLIKYGVFSEQIKMQWHGDALVKSKADLEQNRCVKLWIKPL